MVKNVILIRNSQNFCFNFHCLKYVDENFKHKVEFIIKITESLAENKSKIERY